MGFWTSEMLRAAGVGAAYLTLFALVEAWRRAGHPHPEWTRKTVHFGGGLIALALPWVLRSHWTVLALGAVFAAIIGATRRAGWLQSVHGVERRSEGGLYFPIAVYLLFLVAHDQPAFYLASLLTLVVSDAVAALVGGTYGRLVYSVEHDRRSIEGSAVFLLATFLAAHLPLLLLTSMGRPESVLIAVQLALIVTLFEAVSIEGSDNLIVPLGAYLLLVKMTPHDAAWIAVQLGVQLAILALLLLLAWRIRMLTFAGTLGASLFFYGAFSLGGPEWIAAPAGALLLFYLLRRRYARQTQGPSPMFQVRATFYTALVASAVFVADNVLETVSRGPAGGGGELLYGLYLVALATQLTLLARATGEATPWEGSLRPADLLRAWGWGVLGVLPLGWALAPRALAAAEVAAVVLVPGLALVGYVLLVSRTRWPRGEAWDVRAQSLTTAVASGIGATVLLLP